MAHSRQRVEPIRIDPNQILLDTPSGFDMRLFANEEVPIDRASLAEAAAMSEIASTVSDLDQRGFFGEEGGEVMRAVFTPDFHKATGIPVGSVLETLGLIFPKAAGSDIGCGMRLIATDLSEDEFARIGLGLDGLLRHVLFEGGRNIPLDAGAREAILRDGVQGLRAPQGGGGIWDQITPAVIDAEVAACHGGGRWQTSDIWRFGDFVRGSGGVSRDSQSGSLSGGNHFLEIGVVDEVMDRGAGWSWGLKRGFVTIMVHNGSLGLGGMVAEHFMDRARAIQPKDVAKSEHGFDPLPTTGPLAGEGWAYLNAMGLAANFAVVNRLMLGMMAIDALGRAAGREIACRTVWDAAHNVVWPGEARHIHRKGATPAYEGEPVIIPGSMGDFSFVMRGAGHDQGLMSAPHGAGRMTRRGRTHAQADAGMEKLRVVTPMDPRLVPQRIREEAARDLREEAPSAYKPILPVIATTVGAGLATPVARLRPLMTAKR